MSALPAILVCLAAYRDNINAVWEAMGRGPNNISRKLCAINPSATWETPATHYMMQDMGAIDTDVARWQALCAGTLPTLDDLGSPIPWGDPGFISQQDAIAACGNNHMQVYSAAGLASSLEANEWRDGIFVGINLQFVPNEPI